MTKNKERGKSKQTRLIPITLQQKLGRTDRLDKLDRCIDV